MTLIEHHVQPALREKHSRMHPHHLIRGDQHAAAAAIGEALPAHVAHHRDASVLIGAATRMQDGHSHQLGRPVSEFALPLAQHRRRRDNEARSAALRVVQRRDEADDL